MTWDIKSVIALIVLVCGFLLIGIYVIRGQIPDPTVVGLVSLPIGAVIGFYFGHINGAATALAEAATNLAVTANATVEKRDLLPPRAAPSEEARA
jgi:hypothetical protein